MTLSRFRTEPGAHALLRISATQREALADALRPGWARWCAAWGLARAEVRVDPMIQGATRWQGSADWRAVGHATAGGLRARVLETGRWAMTRLAMALPLSATWRPGSVAADLEREADAALNEWLAEALGPVAPGDEGCLAPSAADLGTLVLIFAGERSASMEGPADRVEYAVAVDAALVLARQGLQAALAAPPTASAPSTASQAAGRRPLVSLTRGIAHLPVKVSVRLDAASLPMSDLLDLAPGDVMPLQHPLSQPATLSLDLDPPEPLQAQAQLGRQADHWAVQIRPLARPTS